MADKRLKRGREGARHHSSSGKRKSKARVKDRGRRDGRRTRARACGWKPNRRPRVENRARSPQANTEFHGRDNPPGKGKQRPKRHLTARSSPAAGAAQASIHRGRGAWKGAHTCSAVSCHAALKGRRHGPRLDWANPQHTVLRKKPVTERQRVSVLLRGSERDRRGESGGQMRRGGGRGAAVHWGQSCSPTR